MSSRAPHRSCGKGLLRLTSLAALTTSLAWGSACGKHVFTRNDLDMEVTKHHINLRWGRIENAAQAVYPEMREAFVEEWAHRSKSVELQDIDVEGVVVEPGDEDRARIQVNITWIDRKSFALRTAEVTEKWIRTDDGWRAMKPIVLDETPVQNADPLLE